jgi:molecular chaperone DnaJ
MALHNPYQVLGIHPTADDEEIKRAYRRLAKQFHPDRNPDSRHSEERFREVSRAYEILRDPKKRANFDRKGFRPSTAQTAGPSPFESDWDLSDIFDNFFSDLHRQNRPEYTPRSERGKDIKFHATVTLEDVVQGIIHPIQVSRMVGCPQCEGNGTTTHSEPQACVVCGGGGKWSWTPARVAGARDGSEMKKH